jgi:hypothetical protein
MTRSPRKNFTIPFIPLRVFLIGIAVYGCGIVKTSPVYGVVKSVEELNGLKSRWANFAAIKQNITVEGRISTRSPLLMRLRGCDLSFRRTDKKALPNFPFKAKSIEVDGYLVPDPRNRRKYFFHVTSIRVRPTDLEVFSKKQRAIRRVKPQSWYELGDWAAARGAFYKDKLLLEKSTEAYRTGLGIERGLLGKGDWAGLLKLAAKSKKLGSSEKLPREWRHEAHRIRWQLSLSKGKPTFLEVVKGLRTEWPECLFPIKMPMPALAKSYAKNPLTTYHDASSSERDILHRLFYREVQLKEILGDAKRDGSNGLNIAKQIDEVLPEEKELAETYRVRELSFRFSQLKTANKDEAVELAKLYQDRKQPQKSTETLTLWLKAQHASRTREGAPGLTKLALDYQKLLNDKKATVELLKRAHQMNPRQSEAISRLEQMGHVLQNGKWVTGSDIKKSKQPKNEKPVSVGKVTIGMSPLQVRRAMFGEPTNIIRMASRKNFSEIWVYGRKINSRIVVHFRRNRDQQRAEATVVNVSQFRAITKP